MADLFILGVAPIDYSPILHLKPFGFRIAPDTLSSTGLRRWPARHYPCLWIQRPYRRRDFNPPDSCTAQRTLSDCRDHDRSQLWSCLCVRRLAGDRRRDLQRAWVTCSGLSAGPKPRARLSSFAKPSRNHFPGRAKSPGNKAGYSLSSLLEGISNMITLKIAALALGASLLTVFSSDFGSQCIMAVASCLS